MPWLTHQERKAVKIKIQLELKDPITQLG